MTSTLKISLIFFKKNMTLLGKILQHFKSISKASLEKEKDGHLVLPGYMGQT